MSSSLAAAPLRIGLIPPPLDPDALVLDCGGRALRGPKGEAVLPGRVFRLAERLMRQPGSFVGREALLEALYPSAEMPDSAEMRLRSAVGDLRVAVTRVAGKAAEVRMSRGAGYALVATRPFGEHAE